MDGNTLVRKNLAVTVRDPVGVYIAGCDDTGWTKPNGSPVGNYWRIIRGTEGERCASNTRCPPRKASPWATSVSAAVRLNSAVRSRST